MSSKAFHALYYHFVWAVKERQPLLEEPFGSEAIHLVRQACFERGVQPLACNTMPNHMHLFVRLGPTVAPATFIGEIKGSSSHEFNKIHGLRLVLKWQDGYGVVTVREAEQERIIHYVENQQTIHASREASRFLERITQKTD